MQNKKLTMLRTTSKSASIITCALRTGLTLLLSLALAQPALAVVSVTAPGAPTIGTTTGSNAQATVTFTAPASNGGSAITSYTATSSPGNKVGTCTASPCTVTGLTNGTAYTFTVKASNAYFTGAASAASNSVIPATVPGAPTAVTATPGNTQAKIIFTAPTSNGGSAITGYTATSSPGNKVGTCTASPCTVTGLTNNTAYTFTVKATNAVGTGVASAASNSVTPLNIGALMSVLLSFMMDNTAPGVPTNVTATAGNAEATVTFVVPVSDGGAAITSYIVTSSPGGIVATCTASPCTVTGLTNNTAYTFTVKATNAIGTGNASAASNSVTPNASPLMAVSLSAQTTSYVAPATLTLSATATGSNGTIAKMEFYNGTTLLGTVTTAPYSLVLQYVTAGNYSFTAKATDTLNATATSTAVALTLTAPPNTAVTSGTQTRTSAFTYDPNTGLLLTETIEPDNAALKLDTTYTYDSYGNKKTVTVSGSDIVSRSSSTTYDDKGRFPTTATNALNHTETRVFEAKFGTITQITGPNGLTSNFAVDTFGRPYTESGPDGVVITTTRALNYAGSGWPTLTAYVVGVTKPGAPTVWAFYDAFNREILTRRLGFDGRGVDQATNYDNLGRVASSSRPYYTSEAAYYTSYTYDLLNRVKTETDAQSHTTYYDYYGLQATRTSAPTTASPSGQTRITLNNSQGQLVSVTDALNHVTQYDYDPFGNLTQTTDPTGNLTILTYDTRGRKIGMNDPDMGVWSYTYNVLGELLTQTDAKLQVTTNTYDLLGRLKTRTESDLTTTWTYDTAIKGIGKLASTTTDNGQTRTFGYDTYGRLNTTSTTLGSTTLSVTTTYDSNGRPYTQTDPAGVQMQNVYNTNGYLSSVRNAQTLQVYWTATALYADGQYSNATFGNNVSETRTIDNLGRIKTVNATHTLGTVTALSYDYDALSNLTTRTDTTQSLTETFGYDALNRLTSVTSSSQAAKSVTYDSLGNITTKSDTGTYTYNPSGAGSVRPHAVTAVSGSWNASLQYDANGNMTVDDNRTLVYTSYNLPTTISKNNQATTLMYGADHERIKTVDPDGTVTLTLNPRLDLGGHYDQITHPNGVVEKVSYLYAGQRPIGIYSTNAQGINGNTTLRYFHLDGQGSIVAITSGDTANAGAVIERLSYDAWGKRRNANGTDDTINTLHASTTDYGYTGQFHLDDVGLIHMNGRVYDPRLGRFMQADPTIQSPGDLQSFNRYSYVLNNPFGYTDPSGYSFLSSLDDHLHQGLSDLDNNWNLSESAGTAAVLAAGYFSGWNPYVMGFVAGMDTFYQTGSLLDGIKAGIITYAAISTGTKAWAGFKAGVTAGTYASAAATYIIKSAAIGYTSTYAMAKVYGATDAEARGMARTGGKRAAVMSGARALYYSTGYDATPKSGQNRPGDTAYKPDDSGRLEPQDRPRNIVGYNENYEGQDCFLCRDAFRQGSPLSVTLNGVPTINAIGGMDDYLNNIVPPSLGNSAWFKLITIPVSVAVTIPALLDRIRIYMPVDHFGREY